MSAEEYQSKCTKQRKGDPNLKKYDAEDAHEERETYRPRLRDEQ
jgi:hypothetical protein